jgi:hypothetical protein
MPGFPKGQCVSGQSVSHQRIISARGKGHAAARRFVQHEIVVVTARVDRAGGAVVAAMIS